MFQLCFQLSSKIVCNTVYVCIAQISMRTSSRLLNEPLYTARPTAELSTVPLAQLGTLCLTLRHESAGNVVS